MILNFDKIEIKKNGKFGKSYIFILNQNGFEEPIALIGIIEISKLKLSFLKPSFTKYCMYIG